MAAPPRLLWIANEADARRELEGIGVDPVGVRRMAGKMLCRLLKLSEVPCRVANILKQEMLAIGADAAVARGSVACSIPTTDVILIGSRKQLHQLCGRLAEQPFGLPALGLELAELLRRASVSPSELRGRSCRLGLGQPLIMGILNVTPDSFSDGGRFLDHDRALQHALAMAGEGADLIDIGGESTRPGAAEVPADLELDRVVPVVEAVCRETGLPVSVDTFKSAVAREAVAAGAEFINDISGLQFDPDMARAVAESGAGLFLMHTRGRPGEMQNDTRYADLPGDVIASLAASLDQARAAGIAEEKLAVDPGIGFGKSQAGNLELLRRLGELHALGRPILLGTSRKSFIGRVLSQPEAPERLHGTMATVALGVERGAHIFRVHDVGPARETARMAWALCHGELPDTQ